MFYFANNQIENFIYQFIIFLTYTYSMIYKNCCNE